MLGLVGVISIPSDEKYSIICVDKIYRDAVAAKAVAAAVPAKENKGKKNDRRDTSKESGSVPLRSMMRLLMTCRRVPTAKDPRLLHLM